jgi:hypothetical protein
MDRLGTHLFHITDIANLPRILQSGYIFSDAILKNPLVKPTHQIGYAHIKERRLNEYRVPCVENKFVGEFVPFYYCPRSPMLFVINKGGTGKPVGYQDNIVHLRTTVGDALLLNQPWAIADGNAGAAHALFSKKIEDLDGLDWPLINSNSWGGKTHYKSAEFLVLNQIPWTSIREIGCMNKVAFDRVTAIMATAPHKPNLQIRAGWYY